MFFENFIYAEENALSHNICDELITKTNSLIETLSGDNKATTNILPPYMSFGTDAHFGAGRDRSDIQFFMPPYLPEYIEPINQALYAAKLKYNKGVWTAGSAPMYSSVIKLQVTYPGDGYHVWHIEQCPGIRASRALAWTIYLNDVDEGGETEFLYQSLRVAPKKGKICIWPAGVTHPHRGNPPLRGEKYILTGWFEYSLYDDPNLKLHQSTPQLRAGHNS